MARKGLHFKSRMKGEGKVYTVAGLDKNWENHRRECFAKESLSGFLK